MRAWPTASVERVTRVTGHKRELHRSGSGAYLFVPGGSGATWARAGPNRRVWSPWASRAHLLGSSLFPLGHRTDGRGGWDSARRMRGPPADMGVDAGLCVFHWPRLWPGRGPWPRGWAFPQEQSGAWCYQANPAFLTAGAHSRKPQGGSEQRQKNGPCLFIHWPAWAWLAQGPCLHGDRRPWGSQSRQSQWRKRGGQEAHTHAG